MKAIVYTRYGPPEVLQLHEVAKPVPKENQVLVKVHAASANALDFRRFENISTLGRLMDSALTKATNTVLGADLAGTIEAVGSAVERYQPGDEVFGISSGTFAEYVCAVENGIARKPANISFDMAAAVPVAALTALQALRNNGQIQEGQNVLIHGASGGVGTFAVQIARYFEAEVTAVCSPRNVDMARQIGADHVIDYTKEDFTQSGQRYDLIVAVNGSRSLFTYRRMLNPGGRYVAAGGGFSQILQAMLLGPLVSKIGREEMGFMGIAKTNHKDLDYLGELLGAGKIVPVIDRAYPLSETAEAVRYIVEEHARGKVIIKVDPDRED
jgi:NADPH:quinone reductase-like Zn-dependent oxidoreductase